MERVLSTNDFAADARPDLASVPKDILTDLTETRDYLAAGCPPWRRLSPAQRARLIREDNLWLRFIADDLGAGAVNDSTTRRQTTDGQGQIYARFKKEIARSAVNALAHDRPVESAKRLLTPAQTRALTIVLFAFCAFLANWPLAALITVNVVATAYFITAILFRVWLLVLGWKETVEAPPAKRVADHELPVITILLPLYRDAVALPVLTAAIEALDCPADKLDVKLLLEEDDRETIEEARRLGVHKCYQTVIVPACAPRTKPKACNVGLNLARGDLIVIYDAEDLPDPAQLRKAAAAFAGRENSLACVQARLNYYNRNDNWLSRLFTLEYSLWFDWLLPALQKMGAPIPLGGTSNFFRTDTLIDVGGWDPYNVTEDADLGLRLARLGFKVELIGSTTFEEANCKPHNWMRQRSRWLKGYLQTWLVHMRDPRKIIATTGWRGFGAVQLFVAGNLFSAIINPIMWSVFLIWAVWRPPVFEGLLPAPILYLNLFALFLGNFLFIAMMMIAPLKRGWRNLSIYGLTAPAYWLLTSLAAYKALWQAVRRPHYWEKTDHFISAAARQKRADALKTLFDNGQISASHRHVNEDRIDTRRKALSENERARQ